MLNVGTLDRAARAALGAGLVAVAFLVALPVWAFWVSLVVGAILAGTAAIGFCPIYAALGLSTRRHMRT